MPQGAAWSGDRPLGPDDARDRLLDATVQCIQRYGREKTALSDIANAAGVTRRTVYRYFEDRDALISAALLRGVQRFTERTRRVMEAETTPGAMVVAAGAFALREAPLDPVASSLIDGGGGLALTQENFRGALEGVRSMLEPVIQAAGWDEDEARDAAEIIMRLSISWISIPNPDRPISEIEAMIRRHLLPALGLD